jgi:hypothetical protein
MPEERRHADLWSLYPRICQQTVKFMSFYILKYVINLISGYSLGI